jgi:hypothetical protein
MMDAENCRRKADQCSELAHSAQNPEICAILFELAKAWRSVAFELDRQEVFRDVSTQIRLGKPVRRER